MSGPEGDCEMCGKPKPAHTEKEAAYCITRLVASIVDESVYMSGP